MRVSLPLKQQPVADPSSLRRKYGFYPGDALLFSNNTDVKMERNASMVRGGVLVDIARRDFLDPHKPTDLEAKSKAQRDADFRAHLNSKEEVKKWNHTIAGVRRARLRALEEKKEREQEEILHQVAEFERMESERKQKMLQEANAKLLMQNNVVREFHSKLLLNEVLKERDLQMAFKKQQQEHLAPDPPTTTHHLSINIPERPLPKRHQPSPAAPSDVKYYDDDGIEPQHLSALQERPTTPEPDPAEYRQALDRLLQQNKEVRSTLEDVERQEVAMREKHTKERDQLKALEQSLIAERRELHAYHIAETAESTMAQVRSVQAERARGVDLMHSKHIFVIGSAAREGLSDQAKKELRDDLNERVRVGSICDSDRRLTETSIRDKQLVTKDIERKQMKEKDREDRRKLQEDAERFHAEQEAIKRKRLERELEAQSSREVQIAVKNAREETRQAAANQQADNTENDKRITQYMDMCCRKYNRCGNPGLPDRKVEMCQFPKGWMAAIEDFRSARQAETRSIPRGCY